MLGAVVDDADQPHGEGDRRVPVLVDDPVEVGVGDGAQGVGGGGERGVEVAAQVARPRPAPAAPRRRSCRSRGRRPAAAGRAARASRRPPRPCRSPKTPATCSSSPRVRCQTSHATVLVPGAGGVPSRSSGCRRAPGGRRLRTRPRESSRRSAVVAMASTLPPHAVIRPGPPRSDPARSRSRDTLSTRPERQRVVRFDCRRRQRPKVVACSPVRRRRPRASEARAPSPAATAAPRNTQATCSTAAPLSASVSVGSGSVATTP